MTPRQLMSLCATHREFEGARGQGGHPGPAAKRVNSQGGAGWLLAVSTGLDRNRRNRTGRAPMLSAPGVG
jgi:hypothetical protein